MGSHAELEEDLRDAVGRVIPGAVALRREIHRHPEPGFKEFATSRRVADALAGAGIGVERRLADTGLTACVEGELPGEMVAVRAEMDALPISEKTGLSYSSEVPGYMHGCGHDVHTAMAVGAAQVVHSLRERLRGSVRFIFQPAEELLAGGKHMVEQGALDDPPVRTVVALHLWPGLPLGTVGLRSGPVLAANDGFTIEIIGRGGHAAMPHDAVDPIVVGCHVVLALQAMVSRFIDPLSPVVVSVAAFNAGSTQNVIPETATLRGTVRSLDRETWEMLPPLLERIATQTASALGAECLIEYERTYPVTVNDEACVELVREVACGLLGPEAIVELGRPYMGSEDFSYYLQRVPGCLAFLGVDREGTPTYPIHHPRFAPPEEVMETGVEFLARWAFRALERL